MPTSTENRPGGLTSASLSTSTFAGVTRYHWLVFIIAAAGWLFDCMGQRIFVLARQPALQELMGSGATSDQIETWGRIATAVMLVGWGIGGIWFGMMSDRWGRVKTMVTTLLIYTAFSGLTGLAQNQYDFLLYRLLGGLGIGGMFGAATTLLAESVPTSVRLMALGVMQTLSAFGNITGSLLSRVIPPGQHNFFHGYAGWRFIFFAGAIPAVMAIFIPWLIHEPEAWQEAKRKNLENNSSAKVGSIRDLMSNPRWRKNLFVGVALGFAGMAGLWGIGFFSPELINTALKTSPQDVVDRVKAYGTTFQDIGSFFGMLTFTFAANYLGRRKAFFGGFILCLVTTVFVYNNLRTGTDAYWMLPIMGFAQLSVFGGYSIYFPELFPTRLRGTGISFCYNTVRFLTAAFTLVFPVLKRHLDHMGVHEPFRRAATILSGIFLLGILALIWAPETKDKPLPEG